MHPHILSFIHKLIKCWYRELRMQFLRGIRVILSWLRTTQWSDSKKIVQNIRFCLKIYHGLQFIHHRSLKSTFVWKIAIFLFSSNQQVLGCLPLWITKIWHFSDQYTLPRPNLPKIMVLHIRKTLSNKINMNFGPPMSTSANSDFFSEIFH